MPAASRAAEVRGVAVDEEAGDWEAAAEDQDEVEDLEVVEGLVEALAN